MLDTAYTLWQLIRQSTRGGGCPLSLIQCTTQSLSGDDQRQAPEGPSMHGDLQAGDYDPAAGRETRSFRLAHVCAPVSVVDGGPRCSWPFVFHTRFLRVKQRDALMVIVYIPSVWPAHGDHLGLCHDGPVASRWPAALI